MENEEIQKQMKLEALRRLKAQNWYEPKTDNPEGLDLDQPDTQPEPVAQDQLTVSEALQNTLSQADRKKKLEELFRQR